MSLPQHSFDSKCYELAEHFFPGMPVDMLNQAAQAIQDCIEGLWNDDSPPVAGWLCECGRFNVSYALPCDCERSPPKPGEKP